MQILKWQIVTIELSDRLGPTKNYNSTRKPCYRRENRVMPL